MGSTKRRQQRKRKYRTNETIKTTSSNKINNSNRSSRVVTKNFEIFVTDFLTDPCGLPVELRDCTLVDETTSLNDTSDLCSSNNSQVLKKIFGNNESIDRMVKNSASLVMDEPSKKTNECEHRLNDDKDHVSPDDIQLQTQTSDDQAEQADVLDVLLRCINSLVIHSLNDELIQRTGTNVPLTEYVSLQSELQHLLIQKQQNQQLMMSSATTPDDTNKN